MRVSVSTRIWVTLVIRALVKGAKVAFHGVENRQIIISVWFFDINRITKKSDHTEQSTVNLYSSKGRQMSV
jgi:hypothetical protein